MEYLYPPQDITSMVELFQYANGVVPLGQIILICIFFVCFLASKNYGWETTRAVTSSIFITFLSSIPLFLLKLVVIEWVYALAVGLAASVVLLYAKEED